MSLAAVSIIVPTFNRLEFLQPAIDSIFAQTFADWELIIADDGSAEPTQAYLRTLACKPRVKVVRLAHTGNLSAVRNAALREATGEFVAFLDSDDLWMPMKLQRQIETLRSHLGCRWSYTGYMRIDASGALSPTPGYERRVRHRGAILEHLLVNAVDIWTPAVMAERRLVAQVGAFDEELPLYEDYDLWLRLASQSEIQLIDEPLICVRSHDQHYVASDGTAGMRACRHRSLQNLRRFVTDPRLLSLVERACARSVLDLAGLHAESDRLGAAKTILSSFTRSWRYAQWWAGLSRVALKMLVPRTLIGLYRRARSASGKQPG
jgi:glycosyltransferase involved in cell wall biosynthesis